MTTASTVSLGLEALLATLVLSRISMAVPAGSSAATAFQKRQARTKMNFMVKAVLTLILSRSKESIANGWNFWNPVARGLMCLVGHGLGRIGSGEGRHH